MRIALVMLSDSAGGIQQTLAPYALALMSGGHEVVAVVSQGSALYDSFVREGLVLSPLLIPPIDRAMAELRIRELRRTLRAFAPDLVIAFAGMGLPQVRRAIGQNVPVISRCGDTSPEIIKPLLAADHVIATTPEMQQILTALGARPDQVSVVPNFFHGPLVAHDYTPRNPLKIGALGRLVLRKGFTDLIDALALLKSQGLIFHAEIAGEGRDGEQIRAQAAASNCGVVIRDWIDGVEKDRFLRSCDILVVPSRNEPFGNVLLEGMQYGLPIVTTATIGARAIFAGQGFVQLADVRRPARLAEAIRSLAGDSSRRETVGRAGQALFAERFTLAKVAPRLLALVEKVHAAWRAKA